MGRFDRNEGEDLRATIEEKLGEIVAVAETRAQEIEDRALAEAAEVEQDAERKAREYFGSSSDRAEQMVAAIDAFEREFNEAISALRRNGEELMTELQGETAPDREAELVEEEADVEPELAAPEPTDDHREMVRRRILDLFLTGNPRAEAERMLDELDDSDRYDDLIDEVYRPRPERQQGSSDRRGGRRRSRPGK